MIQTTKPFIVKRDRQRRERGPNANIINCKWNYEENTTFALYNNNKMKY